MIPSSAPGPSRWPRLIMLLMAIGVPSAAGLTFTNQITQNPWEALSLGLLYEVMIFVAGSVAKVWNRLETRWLDHVADRIDTATKSFVAGYHYRKRYLQYLVYQHRFFDVKGLTTQGPYNLMLEQVFVELRLVPHPYHDISTNPIEPVSTRLHQGQHPIWSYLTSAPMLTSHLAILGSPGCGKTTLLKNLTLTLANRRKPSGVKIRHRFPILLFLRDHVNTMAENPDVTLEQVIVDALERKDGPVPPSGWFERRFKAGECLIMLDGLDEVADPGSRRQVARWVERQMTAYSNNRFVVTSRPFGYQSNPLAGVSVLNVQPLTSAQVEQFVLHWYLANEIMSAQRDDPGVHMLSRQAAQDLLHRLHSNAALAELSVNPLLLSMIANIHRYRSTLPGRRVELYAEICEVFLGKHQEVRGIKLDLTPTQKQSVLQVLAYEMMCRQVREIALQDAVTIIQEPLVLVNWQGSGQTFLQMVEQSSGLLLERENGVYSFAHLTFQEYLAAVYVHEHHCEQDLVAQIEISWWHETIRLFAAQADATPIVAACLRNENPSVVALMLAVECREEAKLLQPVLHAQLEDVLTKGVEHEDESRRQLAGEVLLSLRLRHMLRLDQNRYVDSSLLTHAEYQLFLEAAARQGAFHQPDHWSSSRFPPSQGRMPVVGTRPSDVIAFCDWLTEREGDGWVYRVPHTDEVAAIRQSMDHDVKQQAYQGFWVRSESEYTWMNASVVDAQPARTDLSQPYWRDLLTLHICIDVYLLRSTLMMTAELATALSRALESISALASGSSVSLVSNQLPDHAFGLALDHAFAATSTLVSQPYPSRARANVRTRARSFANSLASTCTAALNGTYDLERIPALVSKLERINSSHFADSILHDPLNVITIFDRITALPDHCDDALDLDRIRLWIHNLELARHTRPLRETYAHLQTIAGLIAPDQQITLDIEGEDLGALEQVMSQVMMRTPNSLNQQIKLSTLRWFDRCTVLILALTLMTQLPQRSRSGHIVPGEDQAKAEFQQIQTLCCTMYRSLVLWEGRMEGILPATEGIWLVKERKQALHD